SFTSRSRSPDEGYSRRRSHYSKLSTSRSRSPDEDYSRRRSHYSELGPSHLSNDKMGWFGRIKNKVGNMFQHHDDHHHHPRDVSTSKEDGNAHTLHRSDTRIL
ncbi:hypothetical protein MKX01_040653, partial [Papaver californicum]